MAAVAEEVTEAPKAVETLPLPVPDLREVDDRLTYQRGDVVVVPIPISNPTFGTGLVLGAAYFYGQTEEQKKVQPASVTGAAGAYTSNKSYAYGIGHQSYWDENRWRFNGGLGYGDFKLSLRAPEKGEQSTLNWVVKGTFVNASVSRRMVGKWYLGGLLRYLEVDQSIEAIGEDDENIELSTADGIRAVGLGAIIEYDNRDNPFNSYTGNSFKTEAVFNSTGAGSSESYQTYSASYSSYHSLNDELVLAWEVKGCARDGETPLWNACTVGLRGFSATDYLGKSSASTQAEARWRFSERWGVVAFAGVGYSRSSFAQSGESERVTSYGFGGRFMVLKSQRINMRLDLAWSDNSEAVYLSVTEAF